MNWYADFERRLPLLYACVALAIVSVALIFVPSGADQKLQQLLADRRYPDAKLILSTAPEGAMRTEQGWADAIEVNAQVGDIAELRKLTDAALEAWPMSSWSRDRKTEVVHALGTLEERIAWSEAQFDKAPTPELFRYVLGVAQANGDISREAQILERAIEHKLTNANHLERLAAIKAVDGDYSAAIELLQEVVETTPNPPVRVRLTLFSLQVDNGQPAEALELALRTGLDPADEASRGAYVFALREEHRETVRALLSDSLQDP